MKLLHALALSILVTSSVTQPTWFLPHTRYTMTNRALTVTCLALLLPLGYALMQWYDISNLDTDEQEDPEIKKQKRSAQITAALSGGLFILACLAKWNIAWTKRPLWNIPGGASCDQLNVACQKKPLCAFKSNLCGYAECGGATCGSQTCAFHAVFNARAVQQLFDAHQPITSAHVQAITHGFQNEVTTQRESEIHDVAAIAQAKGVNNVHYLRGEDGGFVPDGVIHEADLGDLDGHGLRFKRNFDDCIAILRNPESEHCAHFLCHVDESGRNEMVGNHWVTVSVTKRAGQPPYLYYCNSYYNNAPLTALKNYLHQLFEPESV